MISQEKLVELYSEALAIYAYQLVHKSPMVQASFWRIWAFGDVLEYHANKIGGDIKKAIAVAEKEFS